MFILMNYSAHDAVEDTYGKRCAARERLRHVELAIRIVLVVLIQELHIRVNT